jgi:hypothetical protein
MKKNNSSIEEKDFPSVNFSLLTKTLISTLSIGSLFLVLIFFTTLLIDQTFLERTKNPRSGSMMFFAEGKTGEKIIPLTSILIAFLLVKWFGKKNFASLAKMNVVPLNLIINLIIICVPGIFIVVQKISGSPLVLTSAPYELIALLAILIASTNYLRIFATGISKNNNEWLNIALIHAALPVAFWQIFFAVKDSDSISYLGIALFLVIIIGSLEAIRVVAIQLPDRSHIYSVTTILILYLAFLRLLTSSYVGQFDSWKHIVIVPFVCFSFLLFSKYLRRHTFEIQIANILLLMLLGRLPYSSFWAKLQDEFHAGEEYVGWYNFINFGKIPMRDFVLTQGYLENIIPNAIVHFMWGDSLVNVELGKTIILAFGSMVYFLLLRRFLQPNLLILLCLLWPAAGYRFLTEFIICTFGLLILMLTMWSWNEFETRQKIHVKFLILQIFLFPVLLVLAPMQGAVAFLSGFAPHILYLIKYRSIKTFFHFTFFCFSTSTLFILPINIMTGNAIYEVLKFIFVQGRDNLVVNGIPLVSTSTSSNQFMGVGWILLFMIAPLLGLFVWNFWLKKSPLEDNIFLMFFILWFTLLNNRYWGRVDANWISRPYYGLLIVAFFAIPVLFSLLYKSESSKWKEWVTLTTIIAIVIAILPANFIVGSINTLRSPNSVLGLEQNNLTSAQFQRFRLDEQLRTRYSDINNLFRNLDPVGKRYLQFHNNNLLNRFLEKEPVPNTLGLYATAVSDESERDMIDEISKFIPRYGIGFTGNTIVNDSISLSLRNPLITSFVVKHYHPIKCGEYIFLQRNDLRFSPPGCKIPYSDSEEITLWSKINGVVTTFGYLPSKYKLNQEDFHYSRKILSSDINFYPQEETHLLLKVECREVLNRDNNLGVIRILDSKAESIFSTIQFRITDSDMLLPLNAIPESWVLSNLSLRIDLPASCRVSTMDTYKFAA